MIVRLGVVEDVNTGCSQEAEVDDSNNAELYGAVPVEEDVLDQEPDQVLDKKNHLLELSILLH